MRMNTGSERQRHELLMSLVILCGNGREERGKRSSRKPGYIPPEHKRPSWTDFDTIPTSAWQLLDVTPPRSHYAVAKY
jgi:hypothetical protein